LYAVEFVKTHAGIYIIKEFVQPKMSLNREFLIWKERGRGVREREVGGRVGRQSYLSLG
jgi:hypothetical protein